MMKKIKKLYVLIYPMVVLFVTYCFNPLLMMTSTKNHMSLMMLFQALFFVCLSACYCLYADCVNTSISKRLFVVELVEDCILLVLCLLIRKLKNIVLLNYQILFFVFILSLMTACLVYYRKH